MSDIDPDDSNERFSMEDFRAAKDEAAKARAEMETVRREATFLRAGVDLESKAGKLLFKAYDGELDADAIKAEAADIGALAAPAPAAAPAQPEQTPAPTYTDDERSQTRERAALATGSEVPTAAPDVNPWAAGFAEYQELRTSGAPLNDAADAVLGRVMEAAYLHHDQRVLHNQAEYEAANRGSSRPS